ncbi:MAG: hypothetical protein QME78_11330 [Thermodesulfobacteriota bacterium]|nr:hypothetical protein [Thermodesulfobacteriota bacterium]
MVGDSEGYKKIVVLENEIEAQLMDSILTERQIPHRMKSYHDTAYGGIFQVQKGWGHVEAPESYRDEIMAIQEDLPRKKYILKNTSP